MKEKIETNQRNCGIDLLRILAMFYILILHCHGQGGIIANVKEGTLHYNIAYFMTSWTTCAVNIFAIISGYVNYSDIEKKHKYSRYIVLWIQVVYYSVLIMFFTYLINPSWFKLTDLYHMLTPVSKNLYWYFTAYTGLFFIMPLLNGAVRGCSKKTLKTTLLLMFIIFSIYDTFIDVFNMISGFTFIWIMLLYLVGAIIKKCDIGHTLKTSRCMLYILLLNIITCLWLFLEVEFTFADKTINKFSLLEYSSPTISLIAALHLIGFSKLHFSERISKVIKYFAPSAFAVYILNNHKIIWDYFMRGLFISTTSSIMKTIAYVIIFSLAFLLISILIDRIRIIIFEIIRIEKFAELIVNVVHKTTVLIYKVLSKNSV